MNRKLNPLLSALILGGVPLLIVVSYKTAFNTEPSILDIGIVFIIGLIFAFIIRSIARNPSQFFTALVERISWVQGHLLAAFYTTLNIIRAIASKLFRLILFLIYLISPIDLLPDILFPIGYADDAGIGFLIYIFTNFALSQELKQKAKQAILDSQIITSFP